MSQRSNGIMVNNYLYASIKLGQLDVVKGLLKCGANVNPKNRYLQPSPLQLAAIHGHFEIMKVLIENGAIIDSRNNCSSATALHYAVESKYRNVTIVKELLIHGAQPDLKTNSGHTALQIASTKPLNPSTLLIIDELVKFGATIDMKNEHCDTALHIATRKGHVDVVRRLLECGADVNCTTRIGMTPLHIASSAGHIDVVKEILLKGPLLNIKAANLEWTPLFLACKWDRTNVVKVLLEAGADLNIQNVWGETSLYKAVARKDVEMVRVILQWHQDIDFSLKCIDDLTALDVALQKDWPVEIGQMIAKCLYTKSRITDSIYPLEKFF